MQRSPNTRLTFLNISIFSEADIVLNSGRTGLLQNGPDAVALYRAPAGAFPYGTVATTKSLVDAIVYSTGDGLSHSLVDKLLPGKLMHMLPNNLNQMLKMKLVHFQIGKGHVCYM